MDCIKKEDEINEQIIKTEDYIYFDIKEEKYINLEDVFIDKETCNDKSWRIAEERNENLELNTSENLTKDGNIGNHICVNCCSAYANEGSLLAHSCQFELKNNLFHKTEKNFTSQIESFKNKQLLMTGEKVDFSKYQRDVQQKTKPFKRTECDYKCIEKDTLARDIRAVHKKVKPFQCRECNCKYSNQCSLSQHISAVHKNKSFNCMECDYKCWGNSTLSIHIRMVHKKEKPFNCSECDYKCSEKGTLARHVRAVHNKEKPFKCSECDYKCFANGDLSKHICRVHKNEKPFNCSECDYKCCVKSRLSKHLREVHKK